MDVGACLLDVGTDGRVAYQIQALSVQAVPERNHLIRSGAVVAGMAVAKQIAPLYVFPKEWHKHVTKMPAGHG